MRTFISRPSMEWSDNEDGGDEPEDRRTSSQPRGEYEGLFKTETRDGISSSRRETPRGSYGGNGVT